MSKIVDYIAERSAKQTERAAFADEMNSLVLDGDKFTAENKTRCEEIKILIDGDPSKGVAGLDRVIHALSMKIGNHNIPVVPDSDEGISAFQKYLVDGDDGLNADERKQFLSTRKGESAGFKFRTPEALTGPATDGTSTSGGGVGVDVYNKVIESLLHYGGVREMCFQFSTAQGNPLDVPNWDTTDQTGAILATRAVEAGVDELDALTETKFGAYTYSSNSLGVSIEYIQDATFALESMIPMRLMRRIARIQNEHFTTGDDSSKPQGLVGGAKEGAITDTITAFTYENLIDLIHSVDPAYRMGSEANDADGGLKAEAGKVGFMMTDAFLQAAKKLEDEEGRPLWLPNMGIAADAPDTLLGYPYALNQNLEPFTTGKVPCLFGNFGYYGIRNVSSMSFHRFTDSAFTLKNQVGFVAFSRNDGRYMGGFTGSGTICNAVAKMTVFA